MNEQKARGLRIGITKWMVFAFLALTFVAIPHLIDDFLFGVPAEFGLSNQTTQILAGIFVVVLVIIYGELVQFRKRGVLGAMFMGIFLALAGFLKHIPLILKPGPYWSGWFSEALIIGLIISGLSLTTLGAIYLASGSSAQES
jgi:hypothetical protein